MGGVIRWLAVGALSAPIWPACSQDDETPQASSGVGQGGEGGGAASSGTMAQAGSGTGSGAASSAVGGAGGPGWSCDDGYDLPSYDGDQSGLCAASESRANDCCTGGCVTASVDILCAPDGSACTWGGACTLFMNGYECGWVLCYPGQAGQGGNSGWPGDCPAPDKALEAWEGANNVGPGLVPCASDVHCQALGQVCNRRFDNRMFCGDLDGAGGTGGAGSGGADGLGGTSGAGG